MKVLLDVCTPVQVRQALPNHDVHTAGMMCGLNFGVTRGSTYQGALESQKMLFGGRIAVLRGPDTAVGEPAAERRNPNSRDGVCVPLP